MNEKIFNFEELYEASFKEYFLNNGLQDIYTSRDIDELKEERIEVKFDIVETIEHEMTAEYTGTGQSESDYFSAILTIAVSTDRKDVRQVGEDFRNLHNYRKALLRKLMLGGALLGGVSNVTPINFPEYYDVYRITKQAESGDISYDTVDVTFLSYTVDFAIKPSVWKN